jgi:hypothetical protein
MLTHAWLVLIVKKYGSFHLTKHFVKTRVTVAKLSCTVRKREWKGERLLVLPLLAGGRVVVRVMSDQW